MSKVAHANILLSPHRCFLLAQPPQRPTNCNAITGMQLVLQIKVAATNCWNVRSRVTPNNCPQF